ncbi:MAG TPA: hypothetical protein VF494_06840 [Candidatus Limnocylindrales bacterium]
MFDTHRRTIPDWRPAGPPRAVALLGAIAIAFGFVVAGVDSRPAWDDTGVTAGLLVVGAALAAALDGRRPWLWTLLVGAPLAIIEVPATGSAASLVGLLFAGIGASLGLLLRRTLAPRRKRPS